MKKVLGIIPARYASTRFPGKPLCSIAGKPMIQHVYENASQSQYLDRVVVATDSRQIYSTVHSFGGEAVLTKTSHSSGTDRVAEAAQKFPGYDIVVNIQGDEPLLPSKLLDRTIEPLIFNENIPVVTLIKKMKNYRLLTDPDIVKVVKDNGGFAMYFSRSAIPYLRHEQPQPLYYQHIGIYAFQHDFVVKFSSLPPTPLERAESLEQLRILQHGYRIFTIESFVEVKGVDTPDDAREVENIILGKNADISEKKQGTENGT